jgi:hypothetical protein
MQRAKYAFNQKYDYTDGIDEELKKIYARGDKKRSLERLSSQSGIPVTSLKQEAARLGLVLPYKQRPWVDPEENGIVARNIHHTVQYIWERLRRQGYNRSITSVRRHVDHLKLKASPDLMTTFQVADYMGVADKTVRTWIKRGLLRAQVKDNLKEPDTSHPYLIRPKWIRDFIQENPLQFDIRKVDQLWFLDIVFDGRIGPSIDELRKEGNTPGLLDQERNEYGEEHDRPENDCP